MDFDVQNEHPFDSQNILSDESNDPDIKFFNEKPETVNSPHYNVDKFSSSSQNLLKNSFPFLHIYIRSMNKNVKSDVNIYHIQNEILVS